MTFLQYAQKSTKKTLNILNVHSFAQMTQVKVIMYHRMRLKKLNPNMFKLFSSKLSIRSYSLKENLTPVVSI